MDEPGIAASPVVDLGFAPQAANRALAVEVLDRAAILARHGGASADHQRLGFHVLMLVTSGHGAHVVDFESVAMTPGTCVRVRPGQVQRFVTASAFDAHVVVWHPDADPADPLEPAWFPGSGAPTSWQMVDEELAAALNTIGQLKLEQAPVRRVAASGGRAAVTVAHAAAALGHRQARFGVGGRAAPGVVPRASARSRGAASRASLGP